MTKKRLLFACIAIMAILLLTGCVASNNPSVGTLDANGKSAGFWSGLWHGIISPITFIISLFSKNVNMYDVYNSGHWYDFGFLFGVSITFGGGGHASKRHWHK